MAEHLLLVCEGRVKVTATSTEGRIFLLRIAVPGDLIGLASVLQGDTNRVSAETLGPCVIKSISRTAFLRFMQVHPDVGQITSLALAREYTSAFVSARRLAFHTSAAGKLASTLLDMACLDHPNDDANESKIPVRFLMQLTHEELGSMAGLSRETVSRLLTRFRREGHVNQTVDHVTLNYPQRFGSMYC